MSNFLQYGYLGFLAGIIFLSYLIIIKRSNRTFSQTMSLLLVFSVLSTLSGGAGYLWASKELEAANAKKSTAALIVEQVASLQIRHEKDMEPLQNLLSNASKKMGEGVLESTRKQYREELVSITELIKMREDSFGAQIVAIKNLFDRGVN